MQKIAEWLKKYLYPWMGTVLNIKGGKRNGK